MMGKLSQFQLNVYSKTLKSSVDFTGKGIASYPNGDVFEGAFKDGVSINYLLTNSINRKGNAKVENTPTLPRKVRKV